MDDAHKAAAVQALEQVANFHSFKERAGELSTRDKLMIEGVLRGICEVFPSVALTELAKYVQTFDPFGSVSTSDGFGGAGPRNPLRSILGNDKYQRFLDKSGVLGISTSQSSEFFDGNKDNLDHKKETEEKDKAKRDRLLLISFRLLSSYRDAVRDVAQTEGFDFTEFWRRAAFVILKDPKILHSVDDAEAEYRAQLGPSRHYK